MEQTFEKFIEKYKSNKFVTSENLDELRNQGFLVEDFLDYLNTNHNLIFHGSYRDFEDHVRPSDRDGWKAYFTEYGSIALVKAVLSNERCNLDYPTHIRRKDDFCVELGSPNEETIKPSGYIYLVQDNGTYIKGEGNIELIKDCNGPNDVIPYVSKLEVLLEDLEQRHNIWPNP